MAEHRLFTIAVLMDRAFAEPDDPTYQEILQHECAQLGCSLDGLKQVREQLGQLKLRDLGDGAQTRQRFGPFTVEIHQWRGVQDCPWGCPIYEANHQPTTVELVDLLVACRANTRLPFSLPWMRFGSIDFELENDLGTRLSGPGIIVHLARAHQFFEGKASPYRTDPEQLCTALGLTK